MLYLIVGQMFWLCNDFWYPLLLQYFLTYYCQSASHPSTALLDQHPSLPSDLRAALFCLGLSTASTVLSWYYTAGRKIAEPFCCDWAINYWQIRGPPHCWACYRFSAADLWESSAAWLSIQMAGYSCCFSWFPSLAYDSLICKFCI